MKDGVPVELQIAQFCRYYGSDLYFAWNIGAHPNARTRDGVIPWRLFLLLYYQVRHLIGLDRLVAAQAAIAGIGLTMGGDKAASAKTLRELVNEALPERS